MTQAQSTLRGFRAPLEVMLDTARFCILHMFLLKASQHHGSYQHVTRGTLCRAMMHTTTHTRTPCYPASSKSLISGTTNSTHGTTPPYRPPLAPCATCSSAHSPSSTSGSGSFWMRTSQPSQQQTDTLQVTCSTRPPTLPLLRRHVMTA